MYFCSILVYIDSIEILVTKGTIFLELLSINREKIGNSRKNHPFVLKFQ